MISALVVNADDLGVSRGATLGVLRAHREGIVTSASLAVTTAAYRHAVDDCVRACPSLGIGLHFTLTHGRPASAAQDVPLLVDGEGRLDGCFTGLLWSAGIRRRADVLEQVARELDAQLDRLAADGILPDHVNGERHVHLVPGIFELVAEASRRRGIPFVRLGRERGLGFLAPSDAAGLVLRGGLVKSLLLSSLSARDRQHVAGLRSADALLSYLYTGRLDKVLERLSHESPWPGITEIMVHPGLPEESAGLDLRNAGLESYLLSPDRRRELDACIAARSWVQGWRLATFGELAREMAA